MKTHEGERLGGLVRRFLVEHLVVERNLSGNTQRSYRDTLRLLIPFAADAHKTAIDRLLARGGPRADPGRRATHAPAQVRVGQGSA